MPAFKIELPDAPSLPTTTLKLINALQGIVVTLHPSEGYGGTAADVEIIHAVDRDGGITVYGHPWDGERASHGTTLHIPLELIGSITVH